MAKKRRSAPRGEIKTTGKVNLAAALAAMGKKSPPVDKRGKPPPEKEK